MDNPLLLANRMAKRLKTLLGRQRAFRGERVPHSSGRWCFSPTQSLTVGSIRARATGLLDSDVTAMTVRSNEVASRASSMCLSAWRPKSTRPWAGIDKPMAKRIAQALGEVGVRPSQRSRKVADLELGELLDEGAGYQDFAAVHPRFEHAHRRVRIYGTPDADPMLREVVTEPRNASSSYWLRSKTLASVSSTL